MDINTSFDQSLNKALFQVKERIYTWKNVLSCAEFLGTLKTYWELLEEGIIGCKYADLNGEAIDHEELQSAANALRYRLNLITAEETEEWLRSRELSLNDLNNYLCRMIRRSSFANQFDHIRKQIVPDRSSIFNELWPEFVLSGEYPRLVTPLVWRAVVSELDFLSLSSINDAEFRRVKEAFCQREGISEDDLPGYLKSSVFLQDEFNAYLSLEANFCKYCDQLVTEENANLLLKSFYNHLIRIEYESASFTDLEHAREAYLCVSEDGISLESIACQTGGNYTKSIRFLDEIPEALRRMLLSTAIGEATPPSSGERTGEFYIHRVLKKTEPKMEDPQVYSRLRRESVKENLGPIAQANTKWLKWDLDLLHG